MRKRLASHCPMPKRRRPGDGYSGSQRVPPKGRGGNALAQRIRLRERESAAQASDRKRYFVPCANAGMDDAEERKAKAVPPKHSCGWALDQGGNAKAESPGNAGADSGDITSPGRFGARWPGTERRNCDDEGRGGGRLPKLGHPFALARPAGWRPCRRTPLIH